MPDHLFIAEKPSLAEAIATARAEMLGVDASKKNGYWAVGPDAVTWLFGHMYELAKPEEYDPGFKRWSLDTLPIVPSRWRRNPHEKNAQHLSGIRGLLKSSKIVVNAGDAEREGQLLVDELLEEMEWDPFGERTKRIWVSSMARKDMLKALHEMFPNRNKQDLFKAAVMRQRADWLHGLNLTRLFTILARRTGADMVVSVGRVQSPTLKLVVDRDREIANFKPVDHYLPNGVFTHVNGSFKADWVIPADHDGLDSEGRLVSKAVADAIAAKVAGKQGKVESFAKNGKSKPPPLPYKLSTLQTDCSKKFGLTAQETLDVAQSLYEKHKATTYPRTDSQYLTKTILNDEAPGIMTALTAAPGSLGQSAAGSNLRLRSAAWDDSKVTDHHGIIPTSEFSASKLAHMSPIERSVFELIAKSFIAQFHPDHTWNSLVATLKVEGETFKATGKQVTAQGWRVVYGAEADDDDDEKELDQPLPTMAKGDPVTAGKTDVSSKRTKPPAAFTDGTLIEAMANIHKFVTDAEVKKRLRENSGIGTEATRANIIETLIGGRKFLARTGSGKVKKITSTKPGQSVIDALPRDVTDPGLTAVWETQLEKISKGEASDVQFQEVLLRTLGRLIEQGRQMGGVSIRGVSVEPLPGSGETCPICRKGRMVTVVGRTGDLKGKRYMRCDNWRKDDDTSCKNVVWPDRPQQQVDPMPGHGSTCPTCGKGTLVTRKSAKSGKRFMSCTNWRKDDPTSCKHVVWDDAPAADAMDGDGTKCTKCGLGTMRTRKSKTGKRFLSCDNWRKDDPKSCDNVVWDNSEPRSGGGRPSGGAARGSSASGRRAGGGLLRKDSNRGK